MKTFNENDLVINQYGEICKVLICNDSEFVVRKLHNNMVDSVNINHYEKYIGIGTYQPYGKHIKAE